MRFMIMRAFWVAGLTICNAIWEMANLIFAIIIVLAVLYSFMPQTVLSAECPGAHRVVLVDQSTRYDDVDRAQIEPALEDFRLSVASGDRIVIATVAESGEASRVLLDGCVPEQRAGILSVAFWLSNATEQAKPFNAFVEQYRAVISNLIDTSSGDLQTTALVSAINRHCGDTVLLLSDMIERETVEARAVLAGRGRLDINCAAEFRAAGYGRYDNRQRRDLTDEEESGLLDVWKRSVEWVGGTFVPSGELP